jgi:type II secretory pathway pseudopilin PulG
MELLGLLVVMMVVGGGVALYRRQAVNQRQAVERAELETQLSTSRRAADEDVTKFGEELQRLDSDVAGHALDEPMQQDYQRALDAYEDAKTSLDAVQKPDEIRHVTEILEDGRYAVACVKARIAGDPLPAKRPPCFFNPAHGPSSRDVEWAPPGGVARTVPACPADAERVLAGADPYIRTVQVGAQRVPYWEGGQAYAPWAQGYYSRWGGSDMLSGVLIGSMLFGGVGNVFGGVGEGLGGIGEGVGDLMGGIGDGIGDIGGGIGDMFGGLFD